MFSVFPWIELEKADSKVLTIAVAYGNKCISVVHTLGKNENWSKYIAKLLFLS